MLWWCGVEVWWCGVEVWWCGWVVWCGVDGWCGLVVQKGSKGAKKGGRKRTGG